ncbi:hypothetical protein [Halobacterium bonnevillei]|uniref:hypothetical protein n=1 Tax=Halobacterium bonnevillei TaxID=2692200 RepID=UPI001F29343D|nr:hypothetical protein [Halobacterium bonnevillei]
MAASTQTAVRRSNAERPDSEYAFVAGLYVAALVAPAVVLALSRVVADAAVLYVGLLVAVTGVTAAAGWAVSRTPGLAVSLGRRDAVWVLVVLPFSWLGGAFGAAALGVEPPDIAAPLAVLGTAGGTLLGIALVAMSRTRHASAALEDAVELAEWEARWPRRWRVVAGGVAVASFAASIIGLLAALVADFEWGWRLYYLLFVGVVLATVGNSRTFRVTDAGLVVEHPLQRQFRPWAAYTSYELTDEALVLRPAAWWRPAHRCDRADIADVDAVRSALNETVPAERERV